VEVSFVERNVCLAYLAEEGPLSPHLAVVELYDNPASFEGLEIVGECHFGAWGRRIEELVMDLSYRMGPCGTVESCGAVTVTCRSKLSYINKNDKSGQAKGSSANILYVRPIGVIMTTEVSEPIATDSGHVLRKASRLAVGAPALKLMLGDKNHPLNQ